MISGKLPWDWNWKANKEHMARVIQRRAAMIAGQDLRDVTSDEAASRYHDMLDTLVTYPASAAFTMYCKGLETDDEELRQAAANLLNWSQRTVHMVARWRDEDAPPMVAEFERLIGVRK